MTITPLLEKKIQNDPSASNFLKDLIESTKTRDPVDVLNDLELLILILNQRITEALHEVELPADTTVNINKRHEA